MSFLRAFFDNESRFGRAMTRCGILIAANLTFLLFCVPVVTIGPAWTALHYTMLETLREKELNPFLTFFRGFRENWKESLVMELLLLALGGFLGLELFWCSQMTGVLRFFRYGLIMLLSVTAVIGIYLFPVTAAFRGSLLTRIQASLYFAMKSLPGLFLVLAVHSCPLALTYLDSRRMPLYAFLWFFIGFSCVTVVTAGRLLPLFTPFLEPEEPDDPNHDEEKTLREMLLLGM